MAYECPRCGGPVHRGGHPVGMMVGLVGALIAAAFGGFNCPKCGSIPKSEFPPEVQQKMTMGSVAIVFIAVAVLVVAIVIIVLINSFR